jgi:hypothetical protein
MLVQETQRRLEATVRREVDVLGKKLRKELNMGLSGASKSLASLSAEVARIQASAAVVKPVSMNANSRSTNILTGVMWYF